MGNSQAEKRNRSGGKSRAESGPRQVPFADRRFVKIDLNPKQKDSFKSLRESGEFDWDIIGYFASEGYHITIKAIDDHATIFVSVTCIDADHHNAGLILTGRGRDTATALAVCAYKDRYLCSDTRWASGENYNPADPDDVG